MPSSIEERRSMMKRRYLIQLLFLFFGFFFLSPLNAATQFPFTVIHTNDLHSHFEGNGPDCYFNPKFDEKDPISGHYARLATRINETRSFKQSRGEPVLLLDSGDFFSGTLFHLLGPNPGAKEFPEMEFFNSMAYDAFTLGNHEFDAGEAGLSFMLQKARRNHLLSGLVASNLYFRKKGSALSSTLEGVPNFLIKEIQTN